MKKKRRESSDPLIKFINLRKTAMEYTDEDAGREWLGINRQAFNRRRLSNGFSLVEIRKILKACNADDTEILHIMRG